MKMISKFKELMWFFRDTYRSRALIVKLAKNDFKTRYAGSYLGMVWAFAQPIATIAVFWFVFDVMGFKPAPIKDFPFLLWLVCGMIPWFFFSEAWNSATSCLYEYSYLVKKVKFRVSILPIIKILSALFVHLVFVVIIFILFALYGYWPHIVNIQVLYYLLCTIALVFSLSLFTTSISAFFKDTSPILSIILQFGFWLTPIFWHPDMVVAKLPEHLKNVFKLNPMYYIVEGYRDTFIEHVWFWHRYVQTPYFWCFTLAVFVMGALLFRKLRPHFPDVL